MLLNLTEILVSLNKQCEESLWCWGTVGGADNGSK